MDADDLVGELEASGLLREELKLRKFFCACCRLIWDKLPSIAQSALERAEKYSEGLIAPEIVANERVKLWEYLGKDSCDFSSSKVNAVRAVICCLYERVSEDDPHQHVQCTLDFCNAVEDHSHEQSELLRNLFKSEP